jgi:hypothetical protein
MQRLRAVVLIVLVAGLLAAITFLGGCGTG